jgi:hypothetical protein
VQPIEIAKEVLGSDERILLIYAFNATGKTRLSVDYKDITKSEDGKHAGVYYNAYSEDLFTWNNDPENLESGISLVVQKSSLNRFHGSLSEDDIRVQLTRYHPTYRFEFVLHDNREEGIRSIIFFNEETDPEDANKVIKVPYKISRSEERTFIWCFFLALFEVEGWADQQSAHFFIDDPVSSLDEHNVFITASTIFDLIEEHHEKRKIIITTHHMGFFSIMADWIGKGEKADKYRKLTRICILRRKDGEVSLENSRSDVFLYHLRKLQELEQAQATNSLNSSHFALLRQVLENIASFLGVGQFRYVLEQIGIEDAKEVANIVNILSHKKVYNFEGDELTPDNKALFDNVFNRIKTKYNFVLHA